MSRLARLRGPLAAAALAAVLPSAAGAQWVRTHEQFYLPASHNWVFRRNYPAADRLFNAFDYGHAILYEELYRRPDGPASRLEERHFGFLTRGLLVRPPRLPLEEGAIETTYAQLAPEAKAMFEWAHILHRQIYDVLADERLSEAEKDREVAALMAYYRSRPELAFSAVPKNMELMEGQYYSTAFREKYPRFNGLIWAYHWLQVGLYEPLLTRPTGYERQTGVAATVTRFRQMLENAPHNMPRLMPMTAAIAPRFAARYPEAAIVFDNLHSMHDVISDILASPRVPPARKREEILRAASRYRDDTSFAMTRAAWLEMAHAMGIENMGGPVTGFLADFPTPTVERGAVMAGGAHAAHGQPAAAVPFPGSRAPDPGARDAEPANPRQGGQAGACPDLQAGDAAEAELRALHRALLADPVVRARIVADSTLLRLMAEQPDGGPRGDFAARLRADRTVLLRIHAVPELHRLWSTVEALCRPAERPSPNATPAPAHQHPR